MYNDRSIDLIRGKFVIHFSDIVSPDWDNDGLEAVNRAYRKALNIAKDYNGRKFHNQDYGGGISFTELDDVHDCLDFALIGV